MIRCYKEGNIMKRSFWRATARAALAVSVIILYLLLWLVEIDPVAWTPPQAPPASGVCGVNDRLTEIEKLAEGYFGPEAVAIDN
jgi:hypothetical protein